MSPSHIHPVISPKWDSASLEHQHMDSVNNDRSLLFVWIMNRHTNVSFSEHYIQIPPNAFPTGLWDRQFLARLEKDISRVQNGSSPKSWLKKFKKYSIVSRGHISYYKNEFSINANALAAGEHIRFDLFWISVQTTAENCWFLVKQRRKRATIEWFQHVPVQTSIDCTLFLRHLNTANIISFFFFWSRRPSSSSVDRASARRGGRPSLPSSLILLHAAILTVLEWQARGWGGRRRRRRQPWWWNHYTLSASTTRSSTGQNLVYQWRIACGGKVALVNEKLIVRPLKTGQNIEYPDYLLVPGNWTSQNPWATKNT